MIKTQVKLTHEDWDIYNEVFIEYEKKKHGWAAIPADRILGLWATDGQEFLDLVMEVSKRMEGSK